MGCCQSLCGPKEYADVEGRFPVIEICDNSDSGSDNELKAKGTPSKDVTPLLEGPTLLAFHNLNISSTSSSVDLEMDQIESILKVAADKGEEDAPEPEVDDRTFEDVRADLDLNEFNSSDAEKEQK